MIWRSTALILAAFAAVGLVVWFSPDLLDRVGLGEFAFVGQLCLAILVLSLLESVFTRLRGPGTADGRGNHDRSE